MRWWTESVKMMERLMALALILCSTFPPPVSLEGFTTWKATVGGHTTFPPGGQNLHKLQLPRNGGKGSNSPKKQARFVFCPVTPTAQGTLAMPPTCPPSISVPI